MAHCVKCGKKKGNGCTLYHFPEEHSLHVKWLEFCNLTQSQFKKSSHRLCEKHFAEEDLYPRKPNGVRWKKKNAIPTIHGPSTSTACVSHSNTSGESLKKSLSHRRCCLPSCNSSDGTTDVSFFKFPSEAEMFNKWAQFCKIPVNSILPSYRLCSLHFSPNDIIDKTAEGVNRQLVRNAIPTTRHPGIKKTGKDPLPSLLVPPKSPFPDSSNNTLTSASLRTSCESIFQNESLVHEDSSQTPSPINVNSIITPHHIDQTEITSTSKNSITDCTTSSTSNTSNSTTEVEIAPNSSNEITRSTTPTTTKSKESNLSTPKSIIKLPRYPALIRTPDVSTPRRAKACVSYLKNMISEKTKTIKVLRTSNQRLRNKLKTVKQLLKHLEKNNLISENARLKLMVNL